LPFSPFFQCPCFFSEHPSPNINNLASCHFAGIISLSENSVPLHHLFLKKTHNGVKMAQLDKSSLCMVQIFTREKLDAMCVRDQLVL